MNNKLISEARRLAEIINRDRFEGKIPESEDTVRLCELLDLLDFANRPINNKGLYSSFKGEA
jgi:hypothetical protein